MLVLSDVSWGTSAISMTSGYVLTRHLTLGCRSLHLQVMSFLISCSLASFSQVVTVEEAKEVAASASMPFFETSARTGTAHTHTRPYPSPCSRLSLSLRVRVRACRQRAG
jgi:hypothetical protein